MYVCMYVQSSGKRASNGLLTNTLEVYVNDPVVDWLKAPLAKEVHHISTYIIPIHL